MAFTRKHKEELVNQYQQWLSQSQAVYLLEYNKMTMKEIDAFRARIREAGGEVHVVKNTLMMLALKNQGYQESKAFEKTSLVCFALKDAAALAKAVSDLTVKTEVFKVKGGYLGNRLISAADVKALAELPPLPVMRARLLGALQAPASQFVRTLAEPARSVASVFRAYSEQTAPAAG
ncbi:MAG TPA: 50S ribosomal protein L10 [Anaerolineaceae bacterium]